MRRASHVNLRRAFATRSAGRKARKLLVLDVPTSLGKTSEKRGYSYRITRAYTRETSRVQERQQELNYAPPVGRAS